MSFKQNIVAFVSRTVLFTKTHRKTSILLIGIVVFVVYILVHNANTALKNIITETVVKRDVQSTVLATGQVTSVTDLDLSFKSSDIIRSIQVKVGDKVTTGQVLATLDNQDELGALTQAQGALKSAQATLKRTLEGATNEEVAVAQTAFTNAQVDLENTKTQQNTLVTNAYRSLLNSSLEARPQQGTLSTGVSPSVSGSYTGTTNGQIVVTSYAGGSGSYVTFNGLATGSGTISQNIPIPVGNSGLYLTFTNTSNLPQNISWVIDIPNTQSTSYVSALNAYNAARETEKNTIASAQAVVDSRQADLNLKRAQARPADIEARQADVLSTQGRVQSASAAYEKTILRAPADGTITRVDIKFGELTTAGQEALVLQDVSNLYIEADINETNIGSIAIGQPVTFTLDAFGKDRVFKGSIIHIDPGATVAAGIVNYKIKVAIADADPGIKPGMNADMTIITYTLLSAIAIPQAVILSEEGKSFVNILVSKTKQKKQITLGKIVDGNQIVVESGLTSGDALIISDTKK